MSSTPSYAAPGEGRSPLGRVGDPRECWSAQLGDCTVKELLLQPFGWGSGENEVPMPQGGGSAPQGHLAVSGDILIVTTLEKGRYWCPVGRDQGCCRTPTKHRPAPHSRGSSASRCQRCQGWKTCPERLQAQGTGSIHRDGTSRGPSGRTEAGPPRELSVCGSHEGLWLRRNLKKTLKIHIRKKSTPFLVTF